MFHQHTWNVEKEWTLEAPILELMKEAGISLRHVDANLLRKKLILFLRCKCGQTKLKEILSA